MAEAVEIAEKHIENIIREAKNCNKFAYLAHPRIITKMKGGRQVVELHVITGKGLNSANKKSVLKPAIQDLCNRLQLGYDTTEGGVLIRIPV